MAKNNKHFFTKPQERAYRKKVEEQLENIQGNNGGLKEVPMASATTLGGIKIGTNLTITAEGVVNATNTTYSVIPIAELTTGTATSSRTVSAKILNDWLSSKSFMTTTHVANSVTAELITSWNTSVTNSHTHSNKNILDATTASFTTALKTKLDGLSNYTLPTATTTANGGVKVSAAVTNVTVSDATDLDTALVLINELKVKLNAKLEADRASGQQAT